MNELKFSTDRNPRLNNIKQGYELQNKFRSSMRWDLIDTFSGEYERNDHNFRHSGFTIWRDVAKGTFVKESWFTNRAGKVNRVIFKKIECWPENP